MNLKFHQVIRFISVAMFLLFLSFFAYSQAFTQSSIVTKATNAGCDNGVAIGGTACKFAGDSSQYLCQPGSVPGNSIWTQQSCQSGYACQGTACAPVNSSSTGICRADQIEIVGYGSNTLTAQVKSGQNCTAYGYVKKNTCNGNTGSCNENEQTIASGNLPISGSVNAACGKSVQIDIDVYQSSPWVNHLTGGGIIKYGGDCPVTTPTPTPTATPTPTPTPTVAPSVCNSICRDHGDCVTGLRCTMISGTENRCRLPANPISDSCQNPTPTPTPTTTPTPTPSPTPSPTPTSSACNTTCLTNSDCVSGLVCSQDGSLKYCRHPDNVSSTSCDTRKTGGFLIRKYHDENGNGTQDSSEKGLAWKFQWDSNADNNWHDYETFADKLGEGGVVTLPEGTQVRIREKAVDGWSATTPTEVTIRIQSGSNQLMVFGNWKGKPQILGITTPKVLPATGFSTLIGATGSGLMYALSLYLKKKGI